MGASPCSVCGTVNRPGVQFCKNCGTRLTGATGPVSKPVTPKPSQAPVQPTAPIPPPTSANTARVPPPSQPTMPITPAPGMKQCPHCGKMNRQGAKRCSACGQPLVTVTAQVPSPSQPTQPVAPPTPMPMPMPLPTPGPIPSARAVSQRAMRAGVSGVSIALLVCLFISLCSSLAGIAVFDTNRPTPTVVAVVRDTSTPTPTFTPPPPPTTVPAIANTPTATANPPSPVVEMKFTQDGRFGFSTLQGDPANPSDDRKPLTYRAERTNNPANGETNNTRIFVDGATPLYGSTRDGRFLQLPALTADGKNFSVSWQYQNIVVTEKVDIVLSTSTHRFDTFRVTYVAENRDTISHTVGMRLMIDTLIGDNDGVPFNVPGRGMVTAPLDLRGNDIPNIVQVYENQDLNNPGVIVQIMLTGGEATTPDRFVIIPWCQPNNQDYGWDIFQLSNAANLKDFHQCGKSSEKLDSAIGIFYDGKPLAPSASRQWVTFYGLGKIERESVTSALSLAKPPERVQVGEEFWIAALVQNPQAGQRVKITLPSQLQLTQNPAEQAVPTNSTLSQVAWRVRAITPGDNLAISVALSPSNDKASTQVSVFALPTATPTRIISPTPCATSVLKPTCP